LRTPAAVDRREYRTLEFPAGGDREGAFAQGRRRHPAALAGNAVG